MTWKILALFLSNVPHLKHYSMHDSDPTQNPGYLSLVRGHWGFKLYHQIGPLKTWELMHAHGLRDFDMLEISRMRNLLVPI